MRRLAIAALAGVVLAAPPASASVYPVSGTGQAWPGLDVLPSATTYAMTLSLTGLGSCNAAAAGLADSLAAGSGAFGMTCGTLVWDTCVFERTGFVMNVVCTGPPATGSFLLQPTPPPPPVAAYSVTGTWTT